MANILNVFNDLRQKCGTVQGNRPGRYALEEAEIDYGIYIEQQKQTNITTVQQRNQLMKINEGLAKYISRNTN